MSGRPCDSSKGLFTGHIALRISDRQPEAGSCIVEVDTLHTESRWRGNSQPVRLQVVLDSNAFDVLQHFIGETHGFDIRTCLTGHLVLPAIRCHEEHLNHFGAFTALSLAEPWNERANMPR